MVTCPKCGTRNLDDAEFCVNCGNVLFSREGVRKRGNPCFGQSDRWETECFGLPHGGAIIGLVIGFLIILWGLGSLYGWRIEFGSLILIILGVLIIAGTFYGFTRRH